MKICKYCGKKELSKQELEIYRKVFKNTSAQIAKVMKKSRKIILQVLYKLEKNSFVIRTGKVGKAIEWDKVFSCSNCKSFGWMSGFNTWSCAKSQGIYFYCNNHELTKEDENGR